MIEQPMSSTIGVDAQHEPAKFKPLQDCQATWVQDQDDNQWIIRDSDGNELGKFPAHLKDKEVMDIVHFARKYELLAFKDGLETGQESMKTVMKNKIIEMDMQLMVLRRQNEELADHLDRLISDE